MTTLKKWLLLMVLLIVSGCDQDIIKSKSENDKKQYWIAQYAKEFYKHFYIPQRAEQFNNGHKGNMLSKRPAPDKILLFTSHAAYAEKISDDQLSIYAVRNLKYYNFPSECPSEIIEIIKKYHVENYSQWDWFRDDDRVEILSSIFDTFFIEKFKEDLRKRQIVLVL